MALPMTPHEALQWGWFHVTSQERLAFLTETMTPAERRALQFGLMVEENPLFHLDDDPDATEEDDE